MKKNSKIQKIVSDTNIIIIIVEIFYFNIKEMEERIEDGDAPIASREEEVGLLLFVREENRRKRSHAFYIIGCPNPNPNLALVN